MAVAFDTAGTVAVGHAVTSLTNSTHTVGVGANRVLLAELGFDVAVTALTVNWDQLGTPTALTVIKAASGTPGKADIWGLVAPVSGAKQAKAAWTGLAGDAFLATHSWTSADQAGGATTFPHSTNGSGTNTPKLIVTSATGNGTAVVAVVDSAISVPTQTALFTDNTGSNANAAASRAAGAATVTHQWTQTGTWVTVGTDIAAAGGGGGTNMPIAQVGEGGGFAGPARGWAA